MYSINIFRWQESEYFSLKWCLLEMQGICELFLWECSTGCNKKNFTPVSEKNALTEWCFCFFGFWTVQKYFQMSYGNFSETGVRKFVLHPVQMHALMLAIRAHSVLRQCLEMIWRCSNVLKPPLKVKTNTIPIPSWLSLLRMISEHSHSLLNISVFICDCVFSYTRRSRNTRPTSPAPTLICVKLYSSLQSVQQSRFHPFTNCNEKRTLFLHFY